ncbi:MAG: hypothetical protein QOE58_753 [Actinomycetota bacterium]|nr:hypothetical protein [Actinomycetota bacterium]
MDPINRRTILGLAVAGSLLQITPQLAAAAPTTPDYGSGRLGDWTTMGFSVSPDPFVNAAIAKGVWMFGDSIAMRGQRDLAVRLSTERGQTLAVNHWAGRPTIPTVNELEKWIIRYGALPRQIVMAVGSNDIFNPPVMAAQIVRTMGLVAGRAEVYWMDVQVSRRKSTAAIQIADQRNSGWVNSQIHNAVPRYQNLHLVPWFLAFASSPPRLTAYLEDGVHPNTTTGMRFHSAVVLANVPAPAPA